MSTQVQEFLDTQLVCLEERCPIKPRIFQGDRVHAHLRDKHYVQPLSGVLETIEKQLLANQNDVTFQILEQMETKLVELMNSFNQQFKLILSDLKKLKLQLDMSSAHQAKFIEALMNRDIETLQPLAEEFERTDECFSFLNRKIKTRINHEAHDELRRRLSKVANELTENAKNLCQDMLINVEDLGSSVLFGAIQQQQNTDFQQIVQPNRTHPDAPPIDVAKPIENEIEITKKEVLNKLKELGPYQYDDSIDNLFKHCRKLGPYLFADGSIYTGFWSKGKRCGRGQILYQDGTYYEGYWENDMCNYKGRCIISNGVSYEGEFKDNSYHGQGKYRWTDGSIYNGQSQFGKRHGEGVYMRHNGSRYQGSWAECKRSGFGVQKYTDGSVYTGQWLNDRKHGKGVLIDSEGNQIVGDWVDDYRVL